MIVNPDTDNENQGMDWKPDHAALAALFALLAVKIVDDRGVESLKVIRLE